MVTAPSSAPRNVSVILVKSNNFLISWKELLPQDENGAITGYIIRYSYYQSEVPQRYQIQVNQYERKFTLDNLNYFTEYLIQLAARTSAGIGPFSQFIRIQTGQSG